MENDTKHIVDCLFVAMPDLSSEFLVSVGLNQLVVGDHGFCSSAAWMSLKNWRRFIKEGWEPNGRPFMIEPSAPLPNTIKPPCADEKAMLAFAHEELVKTLRGGKWERK